MRTRGRASARSFIGLLTAHFRITAAQLRAAVGRPEGLRYQRPRAILLCLSFVSLTAAAQPVTPSEIERLLSDYVAMNGRNFLWDRVKKNRQTGAFEAV